VFCGAAARDASALLSKAPTLAEIARSERAFRRLMRTQADRFRGLQLRTTEEAMHEPRFGWGRADVRFVEETAWRPAVRVCERGHMCAAWACDLLTEGDKEYEETYAGWKMRYNNGFNMGET
jgi:hypothetical protein